MIKTECKRIREAIKGHQAELKILTSMIRAIQDGCAHEGQKVGYNDRDGDWASPCPTCGMSR